MSWVYTGHVGGPPGQPRHRVRANVPTAAPHVCRTCNGELQPEHRDFNNTDETPWVQVTVTFVPNSVAPPMTPWVSIPAPHFLVEVDPPDRGQLKGLKDLGLLPYNSTATSFRLMPSYNHATGWQSLQEWETGMWVDGRDDHMVWEDLAPRHPNRPVGTPNFNHPLYRNERRRPVPPEGQCPTGDRRDPSTHRGHYFAIRRETNQNGERLQMRRLDPSNHLNVQPFTRYEFCYADKYEDNLVRIPPAFLNPPLRHYQDGEASALQYSVHPTPTPWVFVHVDFVTPGNYQHGLRVTPWLPVRNQPVRTLGPWLDLRRNPLPGPGGGIHFQYTDLTHWNALQVNGPRCKTDRKGFTIHGNGFRPSRIYGVFVEAGNTNAADFYDVKGWRQVMHDIRGMSDGGYTVAWNWFAIRRVSARTLEFGGTFMPVNGWNTAYP